MPHDETLLKTRKNDVFALLSRAGLTPSEFEWHSKIHTSRSRFGPVSRIFSVLIHPRTGYFCEFQPSWVLSYSPGVELMVEFVEIGGDWSDVVEALSVWVQCLERELNAPDAWAELRADGIDRLAQAERATTALQSAGKLTAASELQEANADLARRPPDLTGAVQHALAALECVARERCGDNATFGKLLERYPDLFPKPLDKGMEKVWGFASEMGRHLQERRLPSRAEAELLVGMATACCTYLARRIGAAVPTLKGRLEG
jgi:hypothetical protein